MMLAAALKEQNQDQGPMLGAVVPPLRRISCWSPPLTTFASVFLAEEPSVPVASRDEALLC